MGKVILICGKICSGKSYYARKLKEKENAVILSTDEAAYDLINNEQGEFYNIFSERVNRYLRKKAVEISHVGVNVILDWGFWASKDRIEISEFFKLNNVQYEWHYIDIESDRWKKQIEERNRRIENGNGGSDHYLDEGLMNKLLSIFEEPNREEPNREEFDVWYINS